MRLIWYTTEHNIDVLPKCWTHSQTQLSVLNKPEYAPTPTNPPPSYHLFPFSTFPLDPVCRMMADCRDRKQVRDILILKDITTICVEKN